MKDSKLAPDSMFLIHRNILLNNLKETKTAYITRYIIHHKKIAGIQLFFLFIYFIITKQNYNNNHM